LRSSEKSNLAAKFKRYIDHGSLENIDFGRVRAGDSEFRLG
jgi:hypothetical protein